MPTISEIEDYIHGWIESVTGRPNIIGNEGIQAPEEPYTSIMVILEDYPDDDVVEVNAAGDTETVRGMMRLDVSVQAIGGGGASDPRRALHKFVSSMESGSRQLLNSEFGIGISGVDQVRDISTVDGSARDRRALLMFSVSASSPDSFAVDTATDISGEITTESGSQNFSVPPDEPVCPGG